MNRPGDGGLIPTLRRRVGEGLFPAPGPDEPRLPRRDTAIVIGAFLALVRGAPRRVASIEDGLRSLEVVLAVERVACASS